MTQTEGDHQAPFLSPTAVSGPEAGPEAESGAVVGGEGCTRGGAEVGTRRVLYRVLNQPSKIEAYLRNIILYLSQTAV